MRLYNEIIDNISHQLAERFQHLGKLKFLELLNSKKRIEYKKYFPESAFQSLKHEYGEHFDFPGLRSELIAAYNIEGFNGKSVIETITFLKQTDLAEDGFPELYKLCCLISTIPASSASVERSFSTLKRVKTYSRNTQTEERLSNLSFISIEKDLLACLKEEDSFYSKVIDKFLKQERRMELEYK